uniref:Cytochrome P450 n=1 Tax=Rhodonia placenta TaxID=104341 RepID=F1SYF5_9APHY|nr:cytochrome P450 [Postia placenta]
MDVLSRESALLAGIAIFTLYLLHSVRARRKGGLPPGPPGIPILGNLLQLNPLRPHPTYLKWAQKYGPIFSIKLGMQRVIVLNTAEVADELLVTRSKLYSSRPDLHVASDLVSDGQRMVLMANNRELKIARRTLQGILSPGPSKKMRNMQDLESRVLLRDLVVHGDSSLTETFTEGPHGEVPERHWFSVFRRYTTSIVMSLSYGQRMNRFLDNPDLHKVYEAMSVFMHASEPGNYLADVFPILRRLPDILAPWRKEGRRMHEWEMGLWGKLLDECSSDIAKGIARTGFVSDYLRARAEAGLGDLPGNGATDDGVGWMRDKFLAYTAASVLEAGSDSSSTVMFSFILFMLSNPDALQRAREEMDRVIGPDRMPGWEDEDRLPWLVACIKETLRIRPPFISGLPHVAEEDDVYNGYFIPKGSMVIGNVYGIHMDPARYLNPSMFDPERFYNADSGLQWNSGPDSQNRANYVFGWGRRFCIGKHLAEASVFIVLARLVWGVDFYAPADSHTGMPILPDVKDEASWTDGLVSAPKIFSVGFKPQSEKHAEVIRRSYVDVQAEWEALGQPVDVQ